MTRTTTAAVETATAAVETATATSAATLVTVGPDWAIIAGTASQPFRLTSATLRVDGHAVAARKGQPLPALRLTPAQVDDVRAALRDGSLAVGLAAILRLTPAAGRGRPRVAGLAPDALAAWAAEPIA